MITMKHTAMEIPYVTRWRDYMAALTRSQNNTNYRVRLHVCDVLGWQRVDGTNGAAVDATSR